jgi:site-specific recombinase XerD
MSPLRRRMIEDMQIRNLTVNTQRVYVEQVVRFARHFRKSPEHLGPAEIRTYLFHLPNERRLAVGSIIVTVSALRFLFRFVSRICGRYPAPVVCQVRDTMRFP